MIRKMTKYSFILLSGDRDGFLDRLSSLGVMDITRSSKAVDESSALMLDRISRYRNVMKKLGKLSFANDPDFPEIERIASRCEEPADCISAFEETEARIGSLAEAIRNCEKEMQSASIWGEYTKEDIDRIGALGYDVRFFRVPAGRYDENWENEYIIQIIEKKENVWFVVLSPKGGGISLPAKEIQPPAASVNELKAEAERLHRELTEQKGRMLFIKGREESIGVRYREELYRLDQYLARKSAGTAAEDHISVLEGFAPAEKRSDIEAFLDTQDVYYLAEEATAEDNPPVQLKNNWFARAFEPIGSLYLLPRYDELDLTPFFAPFYMLFFGLCVGDLGYGLILLAAGIALHFKMPKMANIGTLVALLGVGSIIMPMLSGTVFGAKLYDILPMSDKLRGMFLTDMQLFWFSLIFGIVQLVFARIIAGVYATVKQGWQAGLSNFGWAAFTLWAALAFTEWNSKGAIEIMSPALSYSLLGFAGVCILFFSSLSKNIFKRIGKGITSVYDVTGLLGDVLSYIRLFGLGMSGGILGMVFNAMAFQLSGIPYVGWVLTVLLLLIGHSLTIFIACLGAFVHPMRLTFVEFYKNVGFTGGGRPYRPLEKR